MSDEWLDEVDARGPNEPDDLAWALAQCRKERRRADALEAENSRLREALQNIHDKALTGTTVLENVLAAAAGDALRGVALAPPDGGGE